MIKDFERTTDFFGGSLAGGGGTSRGGDWRGLGGVICPGRGATGREGNEDDDSEDDVIVMFIRA